ncbi:MAG: hypothetical protein ABIR84_10935 [Candidatus Nitrotoga sp.]
MLNLKSVVVALILAISSSAWAFMPANGMWGVDSEDNGLPGRGFQIEVENEIMVLTYFGYRADGSSVFYYAAGPIANNTFTASLLDLRDGTSFGSVYKPASLLNPAGTVTMNFTSGKHGFITLPGEKKRAVSKRPFGYADGPDGLLGQWMLSTIVADDIFTGARTFNRKLGASSTGNGVVTTASTDVGCEFQVSGEFAEMVLCVDIPLTFDTDIFAFKFSGDHGTGIYYWVTAMTGDTPSSFSSNYEAHALRLATKTGAKTGLNDGTKTSLSTHALRMPAKILVNHSAKNLEKKNSSGMEKSLSQEDSIKTAALAAWASEVRAIMQTGQ